MPKTLVILLCAASFLLGAALTYQYKDTSLHYKIDANRNIERWFELAAPANSDEKLISYAPDPSFKTIAKLPSVTSLSGRAKFVQNNTGNKPEIKLGYTIDADIAPLDMPAANDKDKEQHKQAIIEPQKLTYEAVFHFIIKDKDGFPLIKISSNKENVSTGTHNHFQLYANNYIPREIMEKAEKITFRMEALRCISCEGEQEHKPKRRTLLQTFMR